MKKFFEYLGLLTLTCFSFFYTEQTASVVKELDDIMINIKKEADSYSVEAHQAIINDNTIIPGINGKKVNVNASYQKMRKTGNFNVENFVYDKVNPENVLEDNLDKYVISGNENKKQVSLIFLVDSYANVDKILNIVDKYEVKTNFFVDGKWFEENNDKVLELVKLGHNIGNLSYNLDYQDSSFVWMDTIIKKVAGQKRSFCYKTEKKEDLNKCVLQKNYTISPVVEISSNPFNTAKNNIKNGSIIAFKINNSLIKELDLIMKYIKSRDLEVVNLETLLSEDV